MKSLAQLSKSHARPPARTRLISLILPSDALQGTCSPSRGFLPEFTVEGVADTLRDSVGPGSAALSFSITSAPEQNLRRMKLSSRDGQVPERRRGDAACEDPRDSCRVHDAMERYRRCSSLFGPSDGQPRGTRPHRYRP
jgi:hypothetical protein